MIVVKRIAGESYDLETGQEIPKTLVLSNGHHEFGFPIDDETARSIIQFMLESPDSSAAPPPKPAFDGETVARVDQEVTAPPAAAPAPNFSLAPDPGDQDGELGEWDDPESGLKSI